MKIHGSHRYQETQTTGNSREKMPPGREKTGNLKKKITKNWGKRLFWGGEGGGGK